MASIKLYYANAKGRAELIRLVLAAGGKEFEDVRIESGQWPKYKPDSPFGQMPFMEIDGKKFGQSVALATYFARESGLYGKSNMDGLMIDQVIQLVQDLISVAVKAYFEKDEAKKAELNQAFKDTESPKFFGNVESLIKENGSDYLVGTQMTLADLAVYDVATGLLSSLSCSLDDFPLVRALVEKVGQDEKVKKYVSERPVTEM